MSLFSELKRRNVFRVGIAYLVSAWLLAQVADIVLDVLGAPPVVLRSLVALLALGLIPTVMFAWVYEMTPKGVRKASEVDHDRSITHHTGKKLDVATIVLLILAIAFVAAERYIPGEKEPEPAIAERIQPEEATPAPSPESTILTADVGAFPASSIAVLPFANRSNQDDDLYFTDGIHDDLLTQLAKIHDLTVISRTSVMKYRDAPLSLKDIGNELNVGTVLEGGVQKVGDRVRINAQLIEVATDRHLWAETFDRELTAENVFELQSEIARKIVTAIQVELSPEEERLLDTIPTRNLAAYDAYLQGRRVFYGANYARSQEEAARPFIERAIELDPEFANAHALLTHIYAQLYWRGIDTSDELLSKYRATLDRAIELNPDSPETLRAQANYHYRVENDYRRSLGLLQQALAAAPGNVDIRGDIGLSLRRLGRWDESIASFQRALQLDPANRFYRFIMLETMTAQKRWQDIIDHSTALEDARPDELDIQIFRGVALFNQTGRLELLKRVFERMNPRDTAGYFNFSTYVPWLRRDPDAMLRVLNNAIWTEAASNAEWRIFRTFLLANAWRLKGEQQEAAAHYERVLKLYEQYEDRSRQQEIFNSIYASQSLAFLGRMDEAVALINRMAQENPPELDAVTGGWIIAIRGWVAGMAGDRESALADLELALNTPHIGPISAWDLHYDPNWDFMRDDPRFVELATPDNLIQ